ncbi:MAG: metal-dependent transcriptional regulator [Anaerolineae bacterium]|nr:metal-dependent transcriptional regulator [Anaerolineae bacterium]
MSKPSSLSKKTKPSLSTRTSPVVLDFLVETYLVSQEIGRVSLRAIADRLDVSAPAVSRMAQRLVRRAYVRREGACGLALTEAGEHLALKAIRKRRIFEVFLVKTMGYSWHEVYPMAAASSNHLDDDLIERMFEQLGHPDRCAHGDPIPSRDGKLETPAAKPPQRFARWHIGPSRSHRLARWRHVALSQLAEPQARRKDRVGCASTLFRPHPPARAKRQL